MSPYVDVVDIKQLLPGTVVAFYHGGKPTTYVLVAVPARRVVLQLDQTRTRMTGVFQLASSIYRIGMMFPSLDGQAKIIDIEIGRGVQRMRIPVSTASPADQKFLKQLLRGAPADVIIQE